MSRLRVMAWAVVMVPALAGLTRGADGQAEPALPPEVAEAFEPAFDRGALVIMTHALELDEDQQLRVRERYDRYAAEFTSEGDAVRREIVVLRPRPVEADTTAEDLDRRIREALAATLAEAEAMKAEGADEETMARWHEEVRRRAQAIQEQSRAAAHEPIEVTAEDFRPVLELLDVWRARRAELRDGVWTDVAGMLRDDQRERLPDLERRLRRRRLLPAGRLTGDAVDLIEVAAGIDPSPGPATAAALAEYAVALDEALREREGPQLEADRLVSIGAIARIEWEDLVRRVDAFMRSALAVRRLQDEARSEIAASLPPDQSCDFDLAALAAAYPRIERPTRAQRLIARAAEIDGLEPSLVEQIGTMRIEVDSLVRRLNDGLIRALQAEEPTRLRSAMFRKARVSAADPGGVQFEQQWNQRRGVSADFVERLRLTLGPRARAVGLEPPR